MNPNSIFEVNYALNSQKLPEPFHTRKARNDEFQTMCFLLQCLLMIIRLSCSMGQAVKFVKTKRPMN